MSRIVQRFTAYVHSDDPLVAASNIVALVVAFNQPFYPLYIRWFVGDDHGASLVTFFSTPLFLAVPAVARRSSLAGRALLPVVGILNTLTSTLAFGAASGVELFLCPCVMIAGMSLRQNERATMLVIVGLALAVFGLLDGKTVAASTLFSSSEYASLLSLNAWSVAMLTAFVALRYSSAITESAPTTRYSGR
jgi:hypothetical protein